MLLKFQSEGCLDIQGEEKESVSALGLMLQNDLEVKLKEDRERKGFSSSSKGMKDWK